MLSYLFFRAQDITDLQLLATTEPLPEIRQNIHNEKAPSEHLEAKPARAAATKFGFSSPADKRHRHTPTRGQTASPKNGYIKPRGLDHKECTGSKSAPKATNMEKYFAGHPAFQAPNDSKIPKQLVMDAFQGTEHSGKSMPIPGNRRDRQQKPPRNDADLNEEFDFDSNLALFDKKKFSAEVKRGAGNGCSKPQSANGYSKPQIPNRHSPRPAGKVQQKNRFPKKQNNNFEEDFDFESNNAMFNKQAEFEAIENGSSVAPVVKEIPREAKYACHENVLQSGPVELRQIGFMDNRESSYEYVSDSGLIIPCVSGAIRTQLLAEAAKAGISSATHIEIIGRSAAEMVLQLCGGSHR
jgi:hypothetical protein